LEGPEGNSGPESGPSKKKRRLDKLQGRMRKKESPSVVVKKKKNIKRTQDKSFR